MSFLNPVNEPVLRFSSTDADAPQINYAARTAGDVKAVLKACLVTGYGAKASAGWSIVNEVDHVAEFVSPSAAMSDYRLGIDDTSAASTTWYYQYQDVRVNPGSNLISKPNRYLNTTHPENGWQLLVTDRGLFFIEMIYADNVSAILTRMTCLSQIKSLLKTEAGVNMGFWATGAEAPNPKNRFFSSTGTYQDYRLGSYQSLGFDSVNLSMASSAQFNFGLSDAIDSPLYLKNGTSVVAEQPGCLLRFVTDGSLLLGVYEVAINSRPALYCGGGHPHPTASSLINLSQGMVFYLDYWEY